MLIEYVNNEELVATATARIKVLNANLELAREENDKVAKDAIKGAIVHLKEIKNAIRDGIRVLLDQDDRFVLGFDLIGIKPEVTKGDKTAKEDA